MKATILTSRNYSFTPYHSDQLDFDLKCLEGERSVLIRKIINTGIQVFKSKPKKYRVIERHPDQLGSSVSLKLFTVDSEFIDRIVAETLSVSDILREMFRLGLKHQESEVAINNAKLLARLESLEKALEGMFELMAFTLARTIYGLEASKLQLDPKAFPKVTLEGNVNLKSVLNQLAGHDIPEWMQESILEKIKRTGA